MYWSRLVVSGGRFAPLRLFVFLVELAVPLFAMGVAFFLGLVFIAPVTAGLHAILKRMAQ
jgi:hypothetical protein